MTEHLYYTDSYRTEFDATVSAVTEIEGRPALVLDRTCFYPTSGGQPYDTGTLAGLPVVDVVAANGDIVHVLDQPVDSSLARQRVHGEIDWPRRYDHMQQHSGQHLISQVFHRLFGYETVSVHFGDQESTLDLDAAEVTRDQLDQAERTVSDMVFQTIPITAYFVSDAEIDSVPLRRPPKVSGEIRIVEIQGTDWSACGGTHVRTTGEIGPVKFVRQQRMRGQARISFLCGQRSLNDYAHKHALITAAAALYDNEIGQVPVLIARDMERLKELQYQVTELQTRLLAYLAADLVRVAEAAGDLRIVARAFDDLDASAVKTLANLLIEHENAVALLASTQGGKATVIFARAADAPVHAGNLLRDALKQFGGGGGGRPDLAQGGGIAPERAGDVLAFAVSQIRAQMEGEDA